MPARAFGGGLFFWGEVPFLGGCKGTPRGHLGTALCRDSPFQLLRFACGTQQRICKKYLTRMAPMKQILEMEIGITGGIEDGVLASMQCGMGLEFVWARAFASMG